MNERMTFYPRKMSARCLWNLFKYTLYVCEQEAAFRKVVQATMVRDRQHGPVVELNRIQVQWEIHENNTHF